jgi:Tfp pilus assembly protein PilN
MAQQINLCTPILLTEKRYFSAQTMVQALAVFLVLGACLCAAWVWNLENASRGFNETLAQQATEIESLQAAITRSRVNAAPVDTALMQQIQDKRSALAARTQLLAALRDGVMVPGFAHSDRLRWVASSIPEPVWITGVKMEDGRFEVVGYTLEPSALNQWVAKLSASPLMSGLRLSQVKVENTSQLATAADKAATGGQAAWSFSLVSAEPPAPPVRPSSAGAKP